MSINEVWGKFWKIPFYQWVRKKSYKDKPWQYPGKVNNRPYSKSNSSRSDRCGEHIWDICLSHTSDKIGRTWNTYEQGELSYSIEKYKSGNLLIFPMFWHFIYLMCSNLPNISSLKTICCQVSSKTTTTIDSNSIGSNPESIYSPVSIDNWLDPCIWFIPWLSINQANQRSYLKWCTSSIIWMESSMNKDKILTFDNMRECYEPFAMSSLIHDFPEITRPLVLSIYPTLVSIT